MTSNGPGDHGPEDAVEVVDARMTGAFELRDEAGQHVSHWSLVTGHSYVCSDP